MRYRNNDTQKNGDIFNILIESLGDKAADHVDTALQKAAKEDPLLAESAYVVWQAIHEVHIDKVAKHLASLESALVDSKSTAQVIGKVRCKDASGMHLSQLHQEGLAL